MSLGVVIIGKNQESYLQSLATFLPRSLYKDIVYVDSYSMDASVQIAQFAGWRVAVLMPVATISASAGRHVGTLLCKSEWILYLDGDMVPNQEMVNQLNEKLPRAITEGLVGFTGNIVNIYPNGAQRTQSQKAKSGVEAIWLGGAAILNRQSVLDAGNWNPTVYANEELDLYARLRHRGGRIIYYAQPLVHHHTVKVEYWKIILGQLGLYNTSSPKNGSFGYAIRSTAKDSSFLSLIRLSPEPFALLLSTILGLIVGIIIFWPMGLAIILVIFLWISIRRGPQYILLSFLLIPQAIIGMFKYRDGRVVYELK